MADEITVTTIEQAIREYVAINAHNKLNTTMASDTTDPAQLVLSCRDFIGVVSLKDLSQELRAFGFVVTYESNGQLATLCVVLNEASLEKGMLAMTARTESQKNSKLFSLVYQAIQETKHNKPSTNLTPEPTPVYPEVLKSEARTNK